MLAKKFTLDTSDQMDLFEKEEDSNHNWSNDYEDMWDDTRGRNIIKALGHNGKDIKIYFDSLDQQYHLFEE